MSLNEVVWWGPSGVDVGMERPYERRAVSTRVNGIGNNNSDTWSSNIGEGRDYQVGEPLIDVSENRVTTAFGRQVAHAGDPGMRPPKFPSSTRQVPSKSGTSSAA